MIEFKKATKRQVKLRLAIYGPSGSGKTATALRLAHGIGGKIALLDTEHYSASRYADGLYSPVGDFVPFDFDIVQLDSPQIDAYIQIIKAAEDAGYETLIIDSLSHGWQELLMEMDKLTQSKFKGNSFQAWSIGTPKQKSLVKALTQNKLHIIATMRAKTEWETVKDDRTGKTKPVRIGLAPEQGKGIEYEFDMLMEVNDSHYATIIKDRSGKFQGKEIHLPGEDLGIEIAAWLTEGDAPIEIPRQALKSAQNSLQNDQDVSVVSQELMLAKKALKQRLTAMQKRKLNGYDNNNRIRQEMITILGIDHLDKATDEHIKLIESWHEGLGKWLEPRDTPFSEPEANKIDVQSVLAEIDAEIGKREIKDSVLDALIQRAMEMAENGDPNIATVLADVKAYPISSADADDDIKDLQSEIKKLVRQMINANIDSFATSAHMSASLKKHLGVDNIFECIDAGRLTEYSALLKERINQNTQEEITHEIK